MTMTDDRVTMAERYSGAVESSNLKLGERRGDLDIVIAAGLGGDPLAGALMRLLVSYDGVRADHRAAELQLRHQEEQARQQSGEKRAATLKEAEGSALLAHVLILAQLTGLDETKERFGAYAVQEATRRRLMKNDREVKQIAGRVLDVFLRPQCGHCDGRGFNGATHRGEKQILCRPCRGSGHRRDAVGKDDTERGFAGHLLMQIDTMLSDAQKAMRSNVHAVADAKHWIAEQSGVAL